MPNQVQHDNRGNSNVTLNWFQGLINAGICLFDYGLWSKRSGLTRFSQKMISLSFEQGGHVETLRIKYSDYARLVSPKVGDFSVHL
jgi:hypothetical protein